MELNGERLIQASVEKTWEALNDPGVLQRCIPGCDSLERTADDTFAASLVLKIGPVSARFKGLVRLSELQPPNGYTLSFEGQGGMAGFGKGTAAVRLTSEGPGQTRLSYQANARVGGKIAQVGSRLVDATAAKLAEDFFKAFEGAVESPAPAAAGEIVRVEAGEAAMGMAARRVWIWGVAAAVAVVALYLVRKGAG
ncbi:MAG: carbon monoxide dehydrogenase subunit G [Burkholderiaceae bacterium]|nr:carbon monoxide dehydrogenase subunit G [Burkholderiaceae bacterium]